MSRYRLGQVSHLNRPFVWLSRQVDRDGHLIDVPVPDDRRHVFSTLVDAGSIVEVDDSVLPAQHWAPLDDAARAMLDKFPPRSAGTVDDLTPLYQAPKP
jgi:hypothetical protein